MDTFILICMIIGFAIVPFAILYDPRERRKKKFKFNIDDVEWTEKIVVIRTVSGKLYKIDFDEYNKQYRERFIIINGVFINPKHIESTELVKLGYFNFKGKKLDVLKDEYGVKVWNSKNNITYYEDGLLR